MKKIIFSIMLFLFTFFCSSEVFAGSVKLVPGTTSQNDMILYLQVDDVGEFTGSCKGLCGFVGTLDYDSSKLELVSIKALQDFDLTQGKKIVLYKPSGVGRGFNILEMKFRSKDLDTNEDTSVSFQNITASDGDKDIPLANVERKVTLSSLQGTDSNKSSSDDTTASKEEQENSTSNTDSNKTKTEETSSSKKSNNSYLASITLSEGKISFSKDTYTYDVVVSKDVDKIQIKATTEDKHASVTGTGEHKLKVGNNEFLLTVTAEDGSKREYTIHVQREGDARSKQDVTDSKNKEQKDDYSQNTTFKIVEIGIAFIVIGICFLYFKSKKKENL